MLFDRLFFKVAAILLLTTYCVSETQAVQPKENKGKRTCTKRTISGAPKTTQRAPTHPHADTLNGVSVHNKTFWNDTTIAVTATQENPPPKKKQKTPEKDSYFRATVIATEPKHPITHPSEPSSAPLYDGKNGLVEEKAPTVQTRQNPSQFLSAEHLTSHQDHTNFLFQALAQARESVMISSYSILPAQLFGKGIDKAIICASLRGVRVYIYYQKLPRLPGKDYRRLQTLIRHCARFEENENHSKCVAQDKTKVAIGSYNWLSETSEHSLNRSWVVSGLLAKGLIADVWQGIRFYESLKHENLVGIQSFLENRDAFSTGAYQFSPNQFLYTLRTPTAHGCLLEDEVFAKAQRKIVISSPFIRLKKLKQTLSRSRLQKLEKKEVRTHLFTLCNPCTSVPKEKSRIFRYLEEISQQYPHFSYSTHRNLHAKTIIADDLLCEGSFNLLSAVGKIDHRANNFEMSVAIRGETAAPFIAAFHASPLAQNIPPLDSSAPPSSLAKGEGVPTSTRRAQQKSKSSKVTSSTRTPLATTKRKQAPYIQIYSGKRFNKQGFCARVEGKYIRDSVGEIVYFASPKEARAIACKVWMSE